MKNTLNIHDINTLCCNKLAILKDENNYMCLAIKLSNFKDIEEVMFKAKVISSNNVSAFLILIKLNKKIYHCCLDLRNSEEKLYFKLLLSSDKFNLFVFTSSGVHPVERIYNTEKEKYVDIYNSYINSVDSLNYNDILTSINNYSDAELWEY